MSPNNSGLAGEIARTFEAVLTVNTPVISIITGEGGSGGALALACGDTVAIQEYAVFSVRAQKARATILYRDPNKTQDLAPLLRPTSSDMLKIGIVDVVLPEEDDAAIIARWLPFLVSQHDLLPRRPRRVTILNISDVTGRVLWRKKFPQ